MPEQGSDDIQLRLRRVEREINLIFVDENKLLLTFHFLTFYSGCAHASTLVPNIVIKFISDGNCSVNFDGNTLECSSMLIIAIIGTIKLFTRVFKKFKKTNYMRVLSYSERG